VRMGGDGQEEEETGRGMREDRVGRARTCWLGGLALRGPTEQ
jgi:hypothetical protein